MRKLIMAAALAAAALGLAPMASAGADTVDMTGGNKFEPGTYVDGLIEIAVDCFERGYNKPVTYSNGLNDSSQDMLDRVNAAN